MQFSLDRLSRAVHPAAVPFAAIALVAAFMATPSFAGLFTNDTINDMHDNDWENVYHYSGSGSLTDYHNYVEGGSGPGGSIGVGDLLLAVVQFDEVKTQNPTFHAATPPGQLTAVSLLRVAGGDGSNATPFSFTSASTDSWQALTGTSGQQGIIASVYENDSGQTYNPNTGTVLGPGGDVSTFTTGNQLWNFGFTGQVNGGNASDNSNNTVAANGSIGEGWRAVAPNNPNNSGNGTFNGAVSLLLPPGPTAPELNTTQKAGNGFDTAGHPAAGQFNSSGNYTSPNSGVRTDLQLNGTVTTGGANGSDFLVSSAGDYYINVAPEPTSLLLMGLGFASFAGARLRRRKASVAA